MIVAPESDSRPHPRRVEWPRNTTYPANTVGHLMEPALGVFRPAMSVRETVEQLRSLVRSAFITYGYVTDDAGHLLGIITMRDLLFAEGDERLDALMLRQPFFLKPGMSLADAMKLAMYRHYPVYPVCDDRGVLVGLVRGETMFAEQAIEITAQPGTMVGVEKEERLATPWAQSFRLRHPWLQLNLITAFVAGAVVGIFEGTVEKLVALAVFLPVLAGQSGNTGSQALAVTLRGLTLGDLRPEESRDQLRRTFRKEIILGTLNGLLVGTVAGTVMATVATLQDQPGALRLGLVVLMAMTGSCATSGLFGVLVPVTLRRLGFDPATASSIFLTTATDIVGMGLLLTLAAVLV